MVWYNMVYGIMQKFQILGLFQIGYPRSIPIPDRKIFSVQSSSMQLLKQNLAYGAAIAMITKIPTLFLHSFYIKFTCQETAMNVLILKWLQPNLLQRLSAKWTYIGLMFATILFHPVF